ncbi:MAG: YihY/virulence factor BrkB family protein [Acidimicrobiia bacterium]
MSTAQLVPETWELTGDDARETLTGTGRRQLAQDAFVRLRAADGFSHARSLAFVIALVMVQGVVVIVGVAAALGNSWTGKAIVRTIHAAAPGPAGRTLTRAVSHASAAGSSGRWFAIALGGIGALVTGATLMGQNERALNRLYGIEQDRPTVQKYARAVLLAVTAGLCAALAFAVFALGHPIGRSLGSGTARAGWDILRWPVAFLAMTAAIALLFRKSPNRHQPAWSWLAYGAAVSVIGWSLVTLGLGLFFRLSGTFGQTYGPLAGTVALLLWALLSSIAILYGAALAAQLEAVRSGRRAPRDEEKAAPPEEEADPRVVSLAR